jgi:predicted O-linked N-acetylglucosamine transferase (SPINDLY family)
MSSDLTRARELLDRGELGQSAALSEKVIRRSPKDADALLLRGLVSLAQSDSHSAAEWLRRAARAAPNRWDVQYDVAIAYLKLDRVDEALRRLEIAAGLNPSSLETQLQLGRAHLDRLKQPSSAVEAFRRAINLAPDDVDALYHLGKALFHLGDVDQAITSWQKARERAKTAGGHDAVTLCIKSIAVAIPGSAQADNAAIFAARREWAQTLEPPQLAANFPATDRTPNRPLTIGYVSSFFDRENWMKPVWALLNEHDRDLFQVRIFSFGPVPGGEKPGEGVDTAWRPHETDRVFDVAGLSNEALAAVIADEKIDLLIDLNGYSDTDRLSFFALRPAPIIVGWFNMYATTALPCYDYIIGDRHVVRPNEEVHYSERVARVGGSYLSFRVGYHVPDVAVAPFTAAGEVTFGSLCSRYKISPDVIVAWSEIMRRCPESRLVLRNAGLENQAEREYLAAAFERQGVHRSRLEFLGRAPHFEFLETYARIDLALDTFPYNGGTTTTEAIWQGVPVVAFSGSTWASRTSATILREGDLGDWVADDLNGYVELAVRWGNDPAAAKNLQTVRSSMRDRLRMSSVCDTVRFAREMESLYRDMWRNWCLGAAHREGEAAAEPR